jgi:phosphatidylglycerol:prolipoprotein diacylglycerol transferase
MHPTLFLAGSWEVRSYGVLLALSFLLALRLAQRRAVRVGVAPETVLRMVMLILVTSIFGSHFLYVFVNYPRHQGFPLAALLFFEDGRFQPGGLVMNGGVVAAVVALLAYIRWHRLPLWKTLDLLTPSLALGIFLTRIGCFLNGCCFGEPTDSFLGVMFSAGSPAGHVQRFELPRPMPLHPTQLYSSAYGLGIFATLLFVERRFRPFDGFTFLLFFVLYALARFGVEFLRYHPDGTWVWQGLTYNQYLCAFFFAVSCATLIVRWQRLRGHAAEA